MTQWYFPPPGWRCRICAPTAGQPDVHTGTVATRTPLRPVQILSYGALCIRSWRVFSAPVARDWRL